MQPQVFDVEEVDYRYTGRAPPMALNKIHTQIQAIATEKDHLIKELQEINNEIAIEEGECERQEAEIRKTEEEVEGEEELRQMVSPGSSKFVGFCKDVKLIPPAEMACLKREVKFILAAQEKYLHSTNLDIANCQTILQEKQRKVSQLTHELWKLESMIKLSHHNIQMFEDTTLSLSKKIVEQRKAHEIHQKTLQQSLKHSNEAASKVAGVINQFLSFSKNIEV
ncbi:uncharacterized protein LOC121858668 isoform X2 [Homarus americanus]|nr:uncharacterized protein LOC121858668 isoform X2 [Homarus americanus]